MTAIHRIITLLNETAPEEHYHAVAAELLHHLHEISTQPIDELAELCNTSITTMSRLARRLGYDGFSAFRAAVVKAVAEYPMENRCMPYVLTVRDPHPSGYFDALRQRIDLLEAAVSEERLDAVLARLHESRKVSFYSGFIHDFTKLQMQYDFVMDGKETAFFENRALQARDAATLGPDCFVIAHLDMSQETYYLIDLLRTAHARGATTFAVAPAYLPNLRQYTDYVLELDFTRTAIDNYNYNIVTAIMTIAYRAKYLDGQERTDASK